MDDERKTKLNKGEEYMYREKKGEGVNRLIKKSAFIFQKYHGTV